MVVSTGGRHIVKSWYLGILKILVCWYLGLVRPAKIPVYAARMTAKTVKMPRYQDTGISRQAVKDAH